MRIRTRETRIDLARRRTFRGARQDGFAIVIALSLMSVILLLLLSLTLLTRVEIRVAENGRHRLAAQENARLGMLIALGNLQKHAGPDQRVTATAEVTGDGNFDARSKFWTGLWETDGTGTLTSGPTWLVSGDAPDPRVGYTDLNSQVVFPSTTNEAEVRAPLVDIDDNRATSGKYAFWIADEGVKASVAARRSAVSKYEDPSLNSERRITEYQSSFGVELSPFFDSLDLDLSDQTFAASLERVLSINDLALIRDSSGNPLQPSFGSLSDLRHHLTPAAFSVLENPIDGGLKKNLSDPTFRDGFIATDETQEFLADKGGVLDVESGLPSRRSFSGRPLHSPRPILTEAVLYLGLFHTNSDGKLRVRFHVQAEFMNPYSLPLRFSTDRDREYDRGLVLLFDNLPTIRVEAVSDGSRSGNIVPPITEDLNNFSSYPSPNSNRYINSWFEFSPTDTADVPMLNPGEVYRVMEPNPSSQARGIVRDFGTVRWSDSAKTKPDPDDEILITAVHPPEGITLTLVPYASRGDPKQRDPVARIRGLQFDDFSIRRLFNAGTNPFSRAKSSDYKKVDYVFAYHFRIRSDESDPESMRDILTSIDLRDPDLNAADTFTDIDGDAKTVSSIFDPIYTDPSFIVQDDSNLFSTLDQVRDFTPRSHANDYNDAFLYDIPDGDVLSVGQLSSLHLYRRKPRSIGSPWGEDFNEVFDKYYFSPKRINPSTTSTMLVNPALTSIGTIASSPDENDAASELAVGAFNINSASVEAWEAVLGAPVLTPEAQDEIFRGSSDVSRKAAFFRLPQYQAEIDEFFVTPAEIQDPGRFFEQGIRSLHGSDGELQLRELAQNIVGELKTRGEPFADMKSFVNSGLLQDAIDAVGTSGGGMPAINEELMEFSNVFLTQNDILTKIAPQATTRSDTFKIRAYGAANDQVTGEPTSEIWCEAIVQRLPEKTDGTDPMSLATEASPRKFQILNIRWLNDETI